MATYKDRVVKSVTYYEPGPLPLEQEDLGNLCCYRTQEVG